MTTITGIYRDGRVELDGPSPDWADGSPVTVANPEVAAAPLDITGDSPEAIAAWMVWHDEFLALARSESAAEELERILAENKAEELALWPAQMKRIEGLFP